jgi:hypothetical protein
VRNSHRRSGLWNARQDELFASGSHFIFPCLLVAPAPIAPPPSQQGSHTVEYSIDGSADSVGITARNAMGGTEQHEINIPYHRTLYMRGAEFVYLSAQNKGKEGAIHVSIRVDGTVLQEARASAHTVSRQLAAAFRGENG